MFQFFFSIEWALKTIVEARNIKIEIFFIIIYFNLVADYLQSLF